MQQHEPAGWDAGAAPTTVDEASMERSKSFVKALQVSRLHARIPVIPQDCPFDSIFFLSSGSACKDPGFPGAVVMLMLSSVLRLVLGTHDRCACVQELKNLRPQIYSASEYCEKSYLHSEQKQMCVRLFFVLPMELFPAIKFFTFR
jgi:hypothetical protein